MKNKVIILVKLIMVLLMMLLLQLPINWIKSYAQNNLIHDSLTITIFSTEYEKRQSSTIIDSRPAEKLAYYQSSYAIVDQASLLLGFALCFLILLDVIMGYKIILPKYLLISVGLLIFYFLLLALSTLSLSFMIAYFICSLITALIFLLYLSHSLGTLRLGVIYTLFIFILYALNYYCIIVFDSSMLFVISGIVMLLLGLFYLILNRRSQPKKVTSTET